MLQGQDVSTSSPSPSSSNFRTELGRLVSPLRRVRPTVPFCRLAAHRIPTLWGLYRGLLRNAPTENIYHRVKSAFRRNHHLIGTEKTRSELQKGYKWLETFERAHSGDTRARALLDRYDRFLEMKHEKEHWKQLAENELAWQHRMKNRPVLTGGFIHPTPYNPPLPRLKPQPMEISRIIIKRLKTRERRFMKMEAISQLRDMVHKEHIFEKSLLADTKYEPVFGGDTRSEWLKPLHETSRDIIHHIHDTTARNMRPFPQELLDQVYAARRNKIANKTRERQRELRGEVLRRTRERRRKGLPPHEWATMSEDQKKEALLVTRSVAEVGYVGALKKRMGWKLKEPANRVEGKTWSVEDGEWIGEADSKAAAEAFKQIQEENRRRREALAENEDTSN